MARTVTGCEEDVDFKSGQREMLAAFDRVVGVAAFVGTDSRPRHVAITSAGSAPRSTGSRPAPRLFGDQGHRPDVIEVTVGQQDRFQFQPAIGQRLHQPVGLVAGVEQKRLAGFLLKTGYEFSATGPTVVPMTSSPAMPGA